MRARRAMAVLAATALAAGLLGTGAGADDGEAGIWFDEVTESADGTAVSGTVVFPDKTQPQDVGGAVTAGFAEPELADPLGIDLQAGLITTTEDGLRFTWDLTSLPPVVPPEVIRYTWSFAVDGEQYQLQAKSSNLIGTTTVDEPAGHLGNVGSDYFQLRGACEAEYMGTPVSGCYHLAFLDGEFDADAGTVTIDLPFDTYGGTEIGPESSLVAAESANMSIAAAVQAAVSNATTTNYINGWSTYHGVPRLELGYGRATASSAASWSPAEVAEDGSFAGTATGKSGTNTTLFARACHGSVCVTEKLAP